MRKDLALTVLWAVVSLTGPLNLDASVDDDADDDAAMECLEFRHDGASGGGHSTSRVLEIASEACGEPIESAWVARSPHGAHGPSAAVAVQQCAAHHAVVNLTVYADADHQLKIAGPLLANALDHCRDIGALKVTIESQGIAPAAVRTMAQSRGFQFSRVQGGGSLEFFTDLYWHPHHRTT